MALRIETALESSGHSFFEKYRLMQDRLLNVEYEHWAAGFAEGNNHGRGHITRVLENLDNLLGPKPLDNLTPYELFLAMMSILYHDIGLLQQRKGHEEISKTLLEGEQNADYIMHPIDREIIAAAVVSHSSSKDIDKECGRFSPEEYVREHRARPRVIAALVRLADETDEDHRRADPILQKRLNLPPESDFFWRFCQRVRGVRPNLVAKRIDFNMGFENEDTTRYGPVPGGRTRHFVAFCAEKLAKINQERVYVNRFLPPELQYGGLHVDLKPLPKHPTWTTPRTFVFNDQTPAEMFLRSTPELLDQPARQAMATVVDLIKAKELDHADKELDKLASVAGDLPVDVQMGILYERACIRAIKAKKARSSAEQRNAALDAATKYLAEWYLLGNSGHWTAMGRTASSEVQRMENDGDLSFVIKERRNQLQQTIPSSLWPKTRGGGGGCVPLGTLIDTPAGPRPIEELHPGDVVLALELDRNPRPVPARIAAVTTSRTTACIRLNHILTVTPTQPVRTERGWIMAGALKRGDRMVNRAGELIELVRVSRVEGYYEIFDLTIDHPSHSFIAEGLLCHNKMYKQ